MAGAMDQCQECGEWMDEDELDNNRYCESHSPFTRCTWCGEWRAAFQFNDGLACKDCKRTNIPKGKELVLKGLKYIPPENSYSEGDLIPIELSIDKTKLPKKEDNMERPQWNQYFMQIAKQVAERSTCTRAKVGAVIVRNRSILATGYNGSPSSLPHCTEVGCLIYQSQTPDGQVEENCFRTIHAEINAIAQAAKNGVSIEFGEIYSTHSPCVHCLKVLINTGIHQIYYEKEYKLELTLPLIEQAYPKISMNKIEEINHD